MLCYFHLDLICKGFVLSFQLQRPGYFRLLLRLDRRFEVSKHLLFLLLLSNLDIVGPLLAQVDVLAE